VQYTTFNCNTLHLTATHYIIWLQLPATHFNILQQWVWCPACCNTWWITATHRQSLQHTATHCSTLQHTATHCNTLLGVVPYLLQHAVTHCSTLPVTATHCSTLQLTATRRNSGCDCMLEYTAIPCNHCNILQQWVCCPTCCNTLQLTICRCSSLQHAATVRVMPYMLQHTAIHCNHATYCNSGCVVLQTATHCNLLYPTATHCNTLQQWAWCPTHCNTLRLTATHCNTLQLTATHCNSLQHTATTGLLLSMLLQTAIHYNHCNMLQQWVCCHTCCNTLKFTISHCNTLRQTATVDMVPNILQHTATLYNSLQLTATHCNSLQHTATAGVLLSIQQQTTIDYNHCNILQHWVYCPIHCNTLQHTATHCKSSWVALYAMRWLWWVCSLKWWVSFAKEPYKTDDILQKRPMILRRLLIVATPLNLINCLYRYRLLQMIGLFCRISSLL